MITDQKVTVYQDRCDYDKNISEDNDKKLY